MQVPLFFKAQMLPMVDFPSCNETEAAIYAETEGRETTDLSFIAKRFSLVTM